MDTCTPSRGTAKRAGCITTTSRECFRTRSYVSKARRRDWKRAMKTADASGKGWSRNRNRDRREIFARRRVDRGRLEDRRRGDSSNGAIPDTEGKRSGFSSILSLGEFEPGPLNVSLSNRNTRRPPRYAGLLCPTNSKKNRSGNSRAAAVTHSLYCVLQ